MQLVTVEKLGETMVLTLPAEVIRALQLQAGEELAIAVEGERLILTRLPALFNGARVMYKALEYGCQEAQVAS